MSAELAWGELDVLHPLLVRAVQCTESLMTHRRLQERHETLMAKVEDLRSSVDELRVNSDVRGRPRLQLPFGCHSAALTSAGFFVCSQGAALPKRHAQPPALRTPDRRARRHSVR